jgi:hypothetical protein
MLPDKRKEKHPVQLRGEQGTNIVKNIMETFCNGK